MNRTAVEYPNPFMYPVSEHIRIKNRELSKRIARILGAEYGGGYDPGMDYSNPLYFVANTAIVGNELTHRLHIESENDLFGGVVPYQFLAEKVIAHSTLRKSSHKPTGWKDEFGQKVRDLVIPGYSVFSVEDLIEVAEKMLAEEGWVRIKPGAAAGGRGQFLVKDKKGLQEVVKTIPEKEVEKSGAVVEKNLIEDRTLSVGQTILGGIKMSYCGEQMSTRDNHGELAYGGSNLYFFRGGFDQMQMNERSEEIKRAVEITKNFDTLLRQYYPEVILSRNNYDLLTGHDQDGKQYLGILEQSWRIGGASGPEVLAAEIMANHPQINQVTASSVERYGQNIEVPEEAIILFRGVDPKAGPMVIFSYVEK